METSRSEKLLLLQFHSQHHLAKRLIIVFAQVMIALSGRNPGLVAVQHPMEFASLRKVRYGVSIFFSLL